MKKLLLVTDAWEPQVNGVVTVVREHVGLLRKMGYEVTLVHPGLFVSIPMPLYPEIRLALFPKNTLSRIFQETQPEYVHIATEGPLGIAARAICLKKNFRFTTSYHTHFPLYAKRWFGFSFGLWNLLRQFHAKATTTMVSTVTLKEELQAHGFLHVSVCPLGVDTDLFVRNAQSSVEAPAGPIFVYFGRVSKEKGIEEFLSLSLPGSKVVIGDGPHRSSLQKKYGKEVHFVGYKRGQELVDWLSVCDVSIFPSVTETFGLTVAEALACGVPVVAHNVRGPQDIITDGVDGFLCEDLADGARKYLQIRPEACREKALQFTWIRSADVFASLLTPVRE